MCKLIAESKGRIWLTTCLRQEGIVHSRNAPTARRRTVLKLLAGSVAGASLSSISHRFASAAGAPAPVGDAVLRLEFDSSLNCRI
jgi:hypothetical protein